MILITLLADMDPVGNSYCSIITFPSGVSEFCGVLSHSLSSITCGNVTIPAHAVTSVSGPHCWNSAAGSHTLQCDHSTGNVRSFASMSLLSQAHTGGCTSLSFQSHGHLVATCGLDKTVQTWDLNMAAHVTTYHVSRGLCGGIM